MMNQKGEIMGFIYKIINDIDNKVYIGQTKNDLLTRMQQHKSTALNNFNKGKPLSPLYKAMITYGIHHFSIEKIEECSDEELDEKEIYWIAQYNSFYNGYNATIGGQFQKKQGQRVIQYGPDGKYIRTFKDIREASKITGIKIGTIGSVLHPSGKNSAGGYQWRYYTENFPLQIPPRVCISNITRAVNQYTLKGELIATFPSAEEAKRQTNINASGIGRACKAGGVATSGGYQWRYVEDTEDIPQDLTTFEHISKTTLPVYQYDKNDNLIKRWDSIKEASEILKIRSSLIVNVCNKIQKTTGGFKWKYAFEVERVCFN